MKLSFLVFLFEMQYFVIDSTQLNCWYLNSADIELTFLTIKTQLFSNFFLFNNYLIGWTQSQLNINENLTSTKRSRCKMNSRQTKLTTISKILTQKKWKSNFNTKIQKLNSHCVALCIPNRSVRRIFITFHWLPNIFISLH